MKIISRCVLFIILLCQSLAYSSEQNHYINYHLQRNNSDFGEGKIETFGANFNYYYLPVNSFSIMTGLESSAGSLDINGTTKDIDISEAELYVNLGWNFTMNEIFSITPFIGRLGHAIRAESKFINNVRIDADLTYAGTNLGALLNFNINSSSKLRFIASMTRTDSGELKISSGSTLTYPRTELKSKMYYRLDSAYSYYFTPSFGLDLGFELNSREIEFESGPKISYDSQVYRAGLTHHF